MRIIYIFWNITPIFIKKLIFTLYIGNQNIQFGTFPLIDYYNKKIIIGNNTYIGEYSKLYTIKNSSITIGKYCSIASGCKIITYNHSIDYPSSNIQQGNKTLVINHEIKNKNINIGNDVWIGFNVIILPGVTIGNGAIVGAGSVVTKNIPQYTIYAGNPAKFIKNRFNKKSIDKLEQLKWWEWDKKTILKNKDFFNKKLI